MLGALFARWVATTHPSLYQLGWPREDADSASMCIAAPKKEEKKKEEKKKEAPKPKARA